VLKEVSEMIDPNSTTTKNKISVIRLDWLLRLMLCLLSTSIFLPPVWSGQGLVIDESEPKSAVVYAVRNIPKGTLISGEDLQETILNSRGVKESDIAIRKFVVGRRAKYEITEGQVIMENCLVPDRDRKNKQTRSPKHMACFVQAIRDIPAGTVVSRADLKGGSAKTGDSSGWLKRVDEAVGMQTKSSIYEGQIITTDLLITNPGRDEGFPLGDVDKK
jgi:flagella basal body P-ring formation protein FlgA